MTVTRPRAERGAFPAGTEHYGRSLLGAPLIWFPAPAASRESGLILAGTHGDENFFGRHALLCSADVDTFLRRHHVVLCES
ncbi:hypothetical protein ACVXHB_28090 [Escherichia coli]